MRSFYFSFYLLAVLLAGQASAQRFYDDGQDTPDKKYQDATFYPSNPPPVPAGYKAKPKVQERQVTRLTQPVPPVKPAVAAKTLPVPLEEQVTDWAFKRLPPGWSVWQRKADGGWYVFHKSGPSRLELAVFNFHQHEEAAKQYVTIMNDLASSDRHATK